MPDGWQGWWGLDANGLSLSGGIGGGGMGGLGYDSYGMRGDRLQKKAASTAGVTPAPYMV